MQIASPRSTSTTVLRWGIAGTMLLALGAAGVSVLEVQRTRRQVDALARTADRSSYLIGEVGRQMTRLRVEALDRLVRPADDQRVAEIDAALNASLRELGPLLQPDEQVRWQRFLPLLDRFRQHLADVMLGLEQGRHDQSRELLATEVGALAAHLEDELDALSEHNQAESVSLLGSADHRLVRMRHFQIGVDLALVLGLAAIWWSVLRILGRQRRELDDYIRRVEQSNRDLDAFAGRIAHDLRNALTPLGFLAARLRRAPSDAGLGAPVAHELEVAVRSCRNLLDCLLAFSRAGQANDPTARACLPAVVDDVVRELAPQTTRLQVQLAIDVENVEVACSPGLLHLVVANLAGNAIKFLDGREVREVRVAAAAGENGSCVLTVADSGPGIPPEALERIFEPFYRVPGVQAAGTGIGLATVRRIVEAHGGAVTATSQVGSGAVFRVRLPLAPTGEKAASAARSTAFPAEPPVRDVARP